MKYEQDDLRLYPIWKHVKTGGMYHILGVGICRTNGEQDGNEVSVFYFSMNHQTLNYRKINEFLDGRFEPVVPKATSI